MHPPTTKALALLGGVATLALGTSLVLRASAPKVRAPQAPCAPRMLELEQATCEPLPAQKRGDALAELGPYHAP